MALGRGHFLSFLLPSCRLLKGPYHRVRGSLLWEVCIKNESLWGENEGFVLIHRASQETSIKSYLYSIRNNNIGKKTNQFSTHWMITSVKKIIDNFLVSIFTPDSSIYDISLHYSTKFSGIQGVSISSLCYFLTDLSAENPNLRVSSKKSAVLNQMPTVIRSIFRKTS